MSVDYMQEEKDYSDYNPRISHLASRQVNSRIRLGDREVDVDELRGFSHGKRSQSYDVGDEAIIKRLKSAGGIVPRDDDDEYGSELRLHGAPGEQFASSNQQGVLIAKSRTEPEPYQSAVVNMAVVVRPDVAYKERKLYWDCAKDATKELVAPLGDVDCFVIHVGEVVWSMKGYTAESYRNAETVGAFIPVYSCVNALPVIQDIVFQGAHIFSQDGNPRTAFNSDAHGTLQTRGTITVHHTGSCNIEVGQQVYISRFPYSYIDEHGNMKPKIIIPGTAGGQQETDSTGQSMGRFLPQIFGISQWDMAAYFAGVDLDVENLIEDSGLLDTAVDTASARKAMERIQYKVDQKTFSESAIDLPAREYAQAAIAEYFWGVHSQDDNAQARMVGEAVLEWIQRTAQKHAASSARYSENLGANSQPFTHPSLNPLATARFLEARTWEDGQRVIDGSTPSAALTKWANKQMKGAIHKQQAFLDSHVCGKSRNAVEPSGSFEIDVGSR